MNKQPISYLQTDSRWRYNDYSAPGEKCNIGEAGCGPTSAAMLISTITGKSFTPADACKWSLARGYKALNQGTYYSYFKPQFAAFGIQCTQLNTSNAYGNPNHSAHAQAFKLLKEGYYLIACMGKGLWTTAGHFIVVWWEDGKVRINDPASTRTDKLNGELGTFKNQVKYYFAVDARAFNVGKKEEEDEVTQEQFEKMYATMIAKGQGDKPSAWAKEAAELAKAKGVFSGDGAGNYDWQEPVTREAVAAVLMRLGLLK